MVRRLMEQSDTKADLIQAAWELFASQGYEAATVNAIIHRVGVSKGSFYHYFEAKEDILDAIVDRMTRHIVEEIERNIADESLSATDRLNRFLETSRQWKLEHVDLIVEVSRVIYRDENVIIRHKMNMRTAELATPVLARIVQQGVDEGTFDTFDPEETAAFSMQVSSAMAEMQAPLLCMADAGPEAPSRAHGLMDLYMSVLERILGAPSGSIERVDEDVFRQFADAAGEAP